MRQVYRFGRIAIMCAAVLALGLLAGCSNRPSGLVSKDVVFAGAHFRVVTVNLKRMPLALYWHNPDTGKAFASIAALQDWATQHGQRVVFAANGGVYDHARIPLGLYVERGRTLRALNRAHGDPAHGNFSLLPNGVFSIDAQGQAHVRTTSAFAAGGFHPRFATQSGPMLVIGGQINPSFTAGSSSTRWRSGVCARTAHKVIFAVSEAPVNFDAFARLFRDQLDCHNALYLDGTLSQFYIGGHFYGAPALLVRPYAAMFAILLPSRPAQPDANSD